MTELEGARENAYLRQVNFYKANNLKPRAKLEVCNFDGFRVSSVRVTLKRLGVT